MQAYNSPLPSDFSATNDAETKPTINFVIVSEDLPRGVLAKHLYDDLVDQMEGEFTFTYEVWPYRGLKDPQLRDLAARDAAEADIIIFAVSGREDLPIEVKTWMEIWVGVSAKPGALVMLSDKSQRTEGYTEQIRLYLRDMADKAHLEFLANMDQDEERENSSLIQNINFRERSPLTLAKRVSLRPQRNGD